MIAIVGLAVVLGVAVAFPRTQHFDVTGAELILALKRRPLP